MKEEVLVLFFPRNVALQTWVEAGLLDRERRIYETHLETSTFQHIYWLTYGENDIHYQGLLPKRITVIPMPKLFSFPFGRNLYSFFLPFLQFRVLRRASRIKTDQMDGSWAAVLAKLLYRKPLLIRTGFTLSLFMKQEKKWLKSMIATGMEWLAYRFADHATVSSEEAKKYLRQRYRIPEEKITVVYNYIDTERFFPEDGASREQRLLFVGRLEPQKNLEPLIRAAAQKGLPLDLYGRGGQREGLETLARTLNAPVRFLGTVENRKLPMIYNRYRYFILSSLFEGMPKTLLEAMACGCFCLGTDTLGIREVIREGENGLLADGFSEEALYRLMERAEEFSEKERVCRQGGETIRERFSLTAFWNREAQIFGEMR